MVSLGVTVPYHERETATSFASRLAMRNLKPSARAFCLDMGLRFQELVDGELTGQAWALASRAPFLKRVGIAESSFRNLKMHL